MTKEQILSIIKSFSDEEALVLGAIFEDDYDDLADALKEAFDKNAKSSELNYYQCSNSIGGLKGAIHYSKEDKQRVERTLKTGDLEKIKSMVDDGTLVYENLESQLDKLK